MNGAASLCMLIAYYGKWVPLEQVRRDCGVSRDGSKSSNILKTARSYGFKAKGYRYGAEMLRDQGKFPCIIHWEFNHFLVCDGFRGGKVYLNDPARGSCAVSFEAFEEAFTGVCLMIEPDEGFQPSGRPKSVRRFAMKRMRGAESAMAFVFVTIAISSLAGIISSGFSRVFLDELLSGKEPSCYWPFLIGLALLALIQLAAAWIKAVYSLRVDGKLAVIGNTGYMWKVLRLPMEFFSQRMAGDIQQRMRANAEIAGQIVNTLAPLLLNTGMTVFYLAVMARYSWLLTIIGVLSVLLQMLISQVISRKRVNITRVMMRDSGRLAAATVSGVEMIETIKASGSENGFFEKWSGYQASVNTQNVRFQRMNQYLGMLPGLITRVTNAAVLALGVWLTMNGQFTAGMVFAFQGFLSSFIAPAQSVISSGQQMQEMRASMERIEDVMEYPEDRKAGIELDETGEEYDKLTGGLEMRHVTFGYSRLSAPLIEDFSLKIEPGQRVAFVGASGCGKSTLAKLISGLYKPWSGEILFDGKPLGDIPRSVFTGSVAVVDQDIILFEDTIANNIKMWDRSIEDYEMIMAAHDAQIHDDIMQRSGGYQYRITEGGRDFSGGQRQRLLIARAIAPKPKILIFDESTSALDNLTQKHVSEALDKMKCTRIVIAHRLSTIRQCDRVIVLDQGRIAEDGTYEELLSKNGIFADLMARQRLDQDAEAKEA